MLLCGHEHQALVKSIRSVIRWQDDDEGGAQVERGEVQLLLSLDSLGEQLYDGVDHVMLEGSRVRW